MSPDPARGVPTTTAGMTVPVNIPPVTAPRQTFDRAADESVRRSAAPTGFRCGSRTLIGEAPQKTRGRDR